MGCHCLLRSLLKDIFIELFPLVSDIYQSVVSPVKMLLYIYTYKCYVGDKENELLL